MTATTPRELCHGRPPQWWTPADPGARLALAICRRCPGRDDCLDGDPQPAGVIRAGVAFADDGTAYRPCPDCGYPKTGSTYQPCGHCGVPSLARWRADIDRWLTEGISPAIIGRRLGASPRQVRDLAARARQAAA